MYHLGSIHTTPVNKLTTDVEQRTTYSLDKCELSIFETHKKVENVRLIFGGFAITSMLRGKKILHAAGRDRNLNYLPGESYILSSDAEMIIDFPDADYTNPTQCTALVIENSYLQKQLEYINENFPRDRDLSEEWNLNLNQLWLQNDENVANLSTRLMRIFSGNDPLKDILVDIRLKELLLSILRLQNYKLLQQGTVNTAAVSERFRAVIEFIRRNITSEITTRELCNMACMSKSVFYRTFTNEFGVPPTQMILAEKIKYAKVLMASENAKIKEVSFALGFSDQNYFARVFKKIEGMTPSEFQGRMK